MLHIRIRGNGTHFYYKLVQAWYV